MATKHRTIADVLERGISRYDGRPSERQARAAVANLTRIIGTVRLTRIDAGTITRYRSARETEGTTCATRNREVGVLRAIFNRHASVKLPPADGEREHIRRRVLTVAEVKAIFAELRDGVARTAPDGQPWTVDVLTVLLATGARVGELLDATHAQLTYHRSRTLDAVGTSAPSGAAIRAAADGETATIRLEAADCKEGDGKVLVLTNGSVAAVRRLQAASRALGATRVCARQGKHPRKRTTANQDYYALRWNLEAAAARAGVADVHLHDLRRTFGSWALQAGATLEQVGQSLGHKSVETTRRVYARIDEGTRAGVGALVTGQL